jgi:hypothetical protein
MAKKTPRVVRPSLLDTSGPSAPDYNTEMPIDLPTDSAGNPNVSGMRDNQVVRTSQGRFNRFNVETGQLSPVVFNVDQDKFVTEDYKTPAGLAALGRRLTSGVADLETYARDTGDSSVLDASQQMQREIDAIDASNLRPQERDLAISQVYSRNRQFFELIDQARVQTQAQNLSQAKFEADKALEVKQYRARLDIEMAREKLFETEGSDAFFGGDFSNFTIPDEEIESAFQANLSKQAKYKEVYDEVFESLNDTIEAHKQAFVQAGYGSVQDAVATPSGSVFTATDRQSFESDYRARNGMSRRNANAMAQMGKALFITQQRIDALASGPLSVEAHRDYVTALVNAGVAPQVAEEEYFQATKRTQGEMFQLQRNYHTLVDRRSAIDHLEQHAVGNITNGMVLKFAETRGINPAVAFTMVKRMYLDDLHGLTPYKVRNQKTLPTPKQMEESARLKPRGYGGI